MYLLWCPKFTSIILASDWFVQSHVSQKKEVLLWSWSVVKKKKKNAAKGNYPPLSCFSLSVRLLKLPYTELSRYISIEYWIIHILFWKKSENCEHCVSLEVRVHVPVYLMIFLLTRQLCWWLAVQHLN